VDATKQAEETGKEELKAQEAKREEEAKRAEEAKQAKEVKHAEEAAALASAVTVTAAAAAAVPAATANKEEEVVGNAKFPGRMVSEADTEAVPEHLYYLFNRHPVLRPGLKEFLTALINQKQEGKISKIEIYTANTNAEWVKFVVKCLLTYLELPLDTISGMKKTVNGAKEVPEKHVLYDDHPENVVGPCVPVDPYNNEVPWKLLDPLFEQLPDDGKGGLQKYIERDKQYPEVQHDKDSEQTLFELTHEPGLGFEEFGPVDVVLLDLDETLISGLRASAYWVAINHFLKYRNGGEE